MVLGLTFDIGARSICYWNPLALELDPLVLKEDSLVLQVDSLLLGVGLVNSAVCVGTGPLVI